MTHHFLNKLLVSRPEHANKRGSSRRGEKRLRPYFVHFDFKSGLNSVSDIGLLSLSLLLSLSSSSLPLTCAKRNDSSFCSLQHS